MDLAEHQRQLRNLIAGRNGDQWPVDPHIRDVALSKGLRLAREVIHLWQVSRIERYCVLTSRLLKQRGTFDEVVRRFAASSAVSPFTEILGRTFLAQGVADADPLVAALAGFEAAAIAVRQTGSGTFVIEWDRDPQRVLASVIAGEEPPLPDPKQRYRTIVSAGLPELYRVECCG